MNIEQSVNQCVMCNKNGHNIISCKDFSALSEKLRYQKAKTLKLCIACLGQGHSYLACKSKCLKCSKKHHTLLHFGDDVTTSSSSENSESALANTAISSDGNKAVILLGTAVVGIRDCYGNIIKCRALLDSGSQVNFISQKMINKLKIGS